MEWLTDERYIWRHEIQCGFWHEPLVLQQYRANRDSNLWRSTREVEKLCEYVLYLESLSLEGARTMSETITTTCDNCEADISIASTYPKYRLRLIEEIIPLAPNPTEDPSPKFELGEMKNFCNMKCLKSWSIKE